MTVRLTPQRIREIFNAMGRDTLDLVDELYAPDVTFVDPFHTVHGRRALRDYYAAMYARVRSIRFDFHGETQAGDELVLYWTMTFVHPRIGGGRPVAVEGCTRLVTGPGGQVVLHRDYFDAGALLYEHLPLLGRLIRFIRGQVG